jgi:hypothetical protein
MTVGDDASVTCTRINVVSQLVNSCTHLLPRLWELCVGTVLVLLWRLTPSKIESVVDDVANKAVKTKGSIQNQSHSSHLQNNDSCLLASPSLGLQSPLLCGSAAICALCIIILLDYL